MHYRRQLAARFSATAAVWEAITASQLESSVFSYL
jgi:hypothetical protein